MGIATKRSTCCLLAALKSARKSPRNKNSVKTLYLSNGLLVRKPLGGRRCEVVSVDARTSMDKLCSHQEDVPDMDRFAIHAEDILKNVGRGIPFNWGTQVLHTAATVPSQLLCLAV